MKHAGGLPPVRQRQKKRPIGLLRTRQRDELAVALHEQRLDLAAAEHHIGLFRLVQQYFKLLLADAAMKRNALELNAIEQL